MVLVLVLVEEFIKMLIFGLFFWGVGGFRVMCLFYVGIDFGPMISSGHTTDASLQHACHISC